MRGVKTFRDDESAQGMTEYAIIVGTLVLAAIVTFAAMGGRLVNIMQAIRGYLDTLPTS